ncbi:MAG: Fic family protein [Alphaproteobacteria bacterium]|nr:Fic family protein [Alphaproteobacteria bacterium]
MSDLFHSMSSSDIKKYMQEHKNELTSAERKKIVALWQSKNLAENKALAEKQAKEIAKTRSQVSKETENIPPYYPATMSNPSQYIQQLYADIDALHTVYQTKLANTLMEFEFWKWMLSENTHTSIALEQNKTANTHDTDENFIKVWRKQNANFEQAFTDILTYAHTEPNLTHDMVIHTASTLMDGIEAEHKNDYRRVSVQMYELGIAVQNPASIRSHMTSLLNTLAHNKDTSPQTAIKKALDVHYNTIFIQPFIDTNKRTSRLLANYYLIQGGYPPILIAPKDQKEYIDAMVELKKTGNPEKYETFMLSLLKHTMEKSIKRLNELPRKKNPIPLTIFQQKTQKKR